MQFGFLISRFLEVAISQNNTSKDNLPNGETADQTKTEKQKKARFIPPTIDEIKAFCAESGISIDAAYCEI